MSYYVVIVNNFLFRSSFGIWVLQDVTELKGYYLK